ncbi:salivary plasminogen activator alpha 1 [Eurytemora carolleeae]|uniref:salivary plasminogen activator alpha 1 n=1 Tax=Eurytemora carolleeae TaxID=1294199 RepID=UPI000C769146|nr:salivary plasminogen activator alpha 1 [Eurytemora carolleeae]|eukprot:XP_023327401.1 salivary plasminogen activator alpha 1-like [Eurytemora affinis]
MVSGFKRMLGFLLLIKVSSACILTDTSLEGFALNSFPAGSYQICQELCQQTEGCLAFTWRSYSKDCSLKNSWYGSQQRMVGAVSGPAYCGQQNCYERNKAYFGNKLINSRDDQVTDSPERCQIECQETNGCKAFTWTLGSNRCNLKSAVAGENKIDREGKISGPVHCNTNVGGVCPPPACVPAWRYGNMRFQGCADPLNQGGLWCPLPLGLDATGNWRNGSTAFAWCNAPSNCVKKWSYLGEPQTYCSTIKSVGRPWCPTPEGVDDQGNYLPAGQFIYCESDMCIDTNSCLPPDNCAEKWFYNGKKEKYCSTVGSPGTPWCPDKYTLSSDLAVRHFTKRIECNKETCSRTPCGQNAAEYEKKIVGGKPADPNEWPWLAALITPEGSFCGATLISDSYLVTAAHCVVHYTKEEMKVKVGEYDFNIDGETSDKIYDIKRLVVHERYDPNTYNNDIALIKLSVPAIFNKSVWPICLPEEDKVYENYRAYVVGWGTIYFGGPVSPTLQEVNIRVWEDEVCRRNYRVMERNITENMICAGDADKDACQGDSGGPLNCLNLATGRWELCGIVSWGLKCAEPDYPGVYTRTTNYLDWIRDNINKKERELFFL